MSFHVNDVVHAQLFQLMDEAGIAMYEDRELTVDGNGVNSHEAGTALQAVAELLGIPGPVDVCNQLSGAVSGE